MRRAAVCAAMACVAALAGAVSASAARPAPVPTRDSVTGQFTLGAGFGTLRVELDASSGPSGEAPGGSLRTSGVFNFDMAIRCLVVRGNRAVVAGRMPTAAGVTHLILVLEDTPAGELDRAAVSFISSEPFPPECTAVDMTGLLNPVREGDVITNVDAPVPPASKKACRKDGWQQLGFPSRRACKRSVVPPPRVRG